MFLSERDFWHCELHHREMLAEAERRRLIRSLPRQPRGGLGMVVEGLRWWRRKGRSRARLEEASSIPWGRAMFQQEGGEP